MRKSSFLIITGAVLLFLGCSSKPCTQNILKPDIIYEKALVNTREVQIIKSLETKASINATLLNEVFAERYPYKKGVYFFIGVITDRKMPEDKFPDFLHFKLNGSPALNIEPIRRGDELYSLMPSVNRWGRYYVAEFAPQNGRIFKLTIGIDPYDPVVLTFQRPTPRR